jgi:enamine deaminase RidA (YjgF/YER057c/UK114 family)
MKERLIEFLAYTQISQKRFEENVGLSNGFVDKVGDSIRTNNLNKISDKYPELNINWLKTGVGDMLKGKNVQKIEKIEDNHGIVGHVAGGVNIHHNEGKDEVIEEQKKEVTKMFEALLEELHGFHAVSKRRDDYVVKQDAYIASIIKHSYLRNEENMKRMDKLFEQQNILIQQQNNLISLVDRQNQKVEERADRLLDILEKKL